MAACPETRDRIEAIAPVSAPTDLFNPRVDASDKLMIERGANYEGHGERSRSQLLFKVSRHRNKVKFGLAVQVWLLSRILLTLNLKVSY